jgi:RNA polymerase sigma factor (sigma-70 family)
MGEAMTFEQQQQPISSLQEFAEQRGPGGKFHVAAEQLMSDGVYRVIRGMSLSLGVPATEVDDVHMTVAERILRNPRSVDTEAGIILGLKTTTYHVLVSRHRARVAKGSQHGWTSLDPATEMSSLSPTPDHAEAVTDSLLLEQAMRHLNPHQQTALKLHYYNDMTVEQIAATLNTSGNTIKSRLVSGREALRKLLSTSPEHTGTDNQL